MKIQTNGMDKDSIEARLVPINGKLFEFFIPISWSWSVLASSLKAIPIIRCATVSYRPFILNKFNRLCRKWSVNSSFYTDREPPSLLFSSLVGKKTNGGWHGSYMLKWKRFYA